ncbi:hypothetical protein ANT2_1656 [plant metagenome]|uniref:DNA adenine methylase n=1 Tax=plant metagenome TaxID=1297885 RepID=A0A484R0V9_9ZZZZ
MRYHGGKWRLAPSIIQHLPPHRIYVEPFGGGGSSVLLRAVKHGRRGRGSELNTRYWADSGYYLQSLEREMATPSLFDFESLDQEAA